MMNVETLVTLVLIALVITVLIAWVESWNN